MRTYIRPILALVVAILFGPTAQAQPLPPPPARLMKTVGPLPPAALASNADTIVIGKVTEVEADAIEASAFKGAPPDQKISFKVAILKIDDAMLGASGLTRIRVGFPADAAAAVPPVADLPAPPRPIGRLARPGGGPPMAVALTAGMDGCFFLNRHHDGDFYVLVGSPLQKKDEKYAKELEQAKKVVKAIDDPVTALKAKDLDDRFQAAQVILQRYQTPRGSNTREPIPAEENKLIVALLAELPWMPDPTKPRSPTEVAPNRNSLWYQINPAELGFKQPAFPPQAVGDPPVDFNKIMDEASGKFLKEEGDKIKIRRFVSK